MEPFLAVSITLSDGRVLRLGPEEADYKAIPRSLQFNTSIPGGFGSASFVISRPPNLYADDMRLFSEVVVYGRGMTIIYEGYITSLRQSGEDEIQFELSGWSTVLDRIANWRQVFVHRELGQWGEPSGARRIQLLSSGQPTEINSASIRVGTDSELAGLQFELSTSNSMRGEAWFDAGAGLTISRFFASEIKNIEGGNISSQIRFTNFSAPTSGQVQEINVSTGDNISAVPTTPTRYCVIYVTGPAQSGPPSRRFSGIAVYGNHNVPRSGANPQGVYGSDALAYMIGLTPLNVFPESIEVSDFVIPHLSFLSDISMREVIEQINIVGGQDNLPNDWGVYENREFFWRSPGRYGKTWVISQDNIASSRTDGPASDLRTSGVKVNYQDPSGITKSIGPAGSFSDTETDELLSVDKDNPAFKIPGYYTETVGVTTEQGAKNIGTVLLNERNRLDWRGDFEIQGEVFDSEGKPYPAHRIRAGDHVIVRDDDDKRPRPINTTSYSHDSLSTTASIGARPDALPTLLGRLAAVTDLFQ